MRGISTMLLAGLISRCIVRKPAPKPSCNCNEKNFCERNPTTCKVGAAAGIGAIIVGAIVIPEIALPACAPGGLAGAAAQ